MSVLNAVPTQAPLPAPRRKLSIWLLNALAGNSVRLGLTVLVVFWIPFLSFVYHVWS